MTTLSENWIIWIQATRDRVSAKNKRKKYYNIESVNFGKSTRDR